MVHKYCTITILFIIFYCSGCVGKKLYSNYTLYRGIPKNRTQVEFLRSLSERFEVKYWREPAKVLKPVEFLIAPKDQTDFIKEADNVGLDVTTILKDVQSAFDKQTVKSYIRRNIGTFNWQNYYRLNDIYNWLADLASSNHDMVIKKIGTSIEGRAINSVYLNIGKAAKRSRVIVEGGIHAREWISPAFVTYMIHQLVHASDSKDPDLQKIAKTYEWYFVPVLNPDGYEYTHTQDRLWRKNRNHEGVDLNRNFDSHFGTVGVSKDPNSETYCGRRAFSEPESEAFKKFLYPLRDKIEYFLSFHSYGQYMILPYAHLKTHVDNYDEVKKMLQDASAQLYKVNNKQYNIGTAFDTVGYSTSGDTGSWVKAKFRIPYVTTFELRDEGQYGFALPPDQIMDACKETMKGMISFLSPRTKSFKQLNIHLPPIVEQGEEPEEYEGNAASGYFLSQLIIIMFILKSFC